MYTVVLNPVRISRRDVLMNSREYAAAGQSYKAQKQFGRNLPDLLSSLD